jgi:hypothetical protein
VIADDFTMSARLARSESVYAARAAEVPRLESSMRLIPDVDACAVWVHGTLSCGLEGLKDLPTLPKIPMYRFEHDTFHEIGENASELARLMNQLGYQRTYILAHSRGGLVRDLANRFCRANTAELATSLPLARRTEAHPWQMRQTVGWQFLCELAILS